MANPRELPILMTGELVRATIEGRKTVTRRVVKPSGKQREWLSHDLLTRARLDRVGPFGASFEHPDGGPLTTARPPYGYRGDLLYVRETHLVPTNGYTDQSGEYVSQRARGAVEYCADGAEPRWHPDDYVDGVQIYRPRWMRKMPSIHMRKSDARLWLRVESIGVERVQDITIAQIQAEGLKLPVSSDGRPLYELGTRQSHTAAPALLKDWTERDHWLHLWANLWDDISAKRNEGAYAWDRNPWVWVVGYSVASTTGRGGVSDG